MRQIVLDTETTGLSTEAGHRIIEIAGIELVDRRRTGRYYHHFLDPQREVDQDAERVHGICREDLVGRPTFADIADDMVAFIRGSELIIHNAPFDVRFLEHELSMAGHPEPKVENHARVLDTLKMARTKNPGRRNNLDALCKRYNVDGSGRELHGALIDVELLADVYLAMTGGQFDLVLEADMPVNTTGPQDKSNLIVRRASEDEIAAHQAMLGKLENSLWSQLNL